jgi:hypothetical protein
MREGGQTATIGKGAYWLPPLMKPITGSGCCALAASGYAMAVPPSRVMNSRRFTGSASRALTKRIAHLSYGK